MLERVGGAELGNVAIRERRGAHDGSAGRHRDRGAVDFQRDAGAGRDAGRSQIVIVLGVHELQQSPRAAQLAALEIFTEMFERAAHRERRHAAQPAQRAVEHGVAELVEQREVGVRACRWRWPAMMRSTSSTPRVEPMRQGVHLPQDSTAQNSSA